MACSITGASPATAARDLADLGALVREGEGRYARYRLTVPLRSVARVLLTEQGDLREE